MQACSSAKRRKCCNDPNIFFYICVNFILPSHWKNITEFIRKVYLAYFKVPLEYQDKTWAPHKVCARCVESLRKWSQGKPKYMKFGIPMIWREPKNHFNVCYFCKVNVKGFNKKNKQLIKYFNLDSALLLVAHCQEVPMKFQEPMMKKVKTLLWSSVQQMLCLESNTLQLVRDLYLPKQYAKPLASRLNEKNFLSHGTSVTYYRNREASFLKYFVSNGQFVYYKDIKGLLLEMGVTYVSGDWRLFIDSSKWSLKCGLLHNGNVYGSIPIGHLVELKQNHCSLKLVLDSLQYENHNWKIWVDLKMVSFLLGRQSEYTKYP